MTDKPYAPSCDRNQDIILQTLKDYIPQASRSLLEVGSGTGQHAIHCASHFPNLTWNVSDRIENHDGIQVWLEEFKVNNIKGPIEYEIGKSSFPEEDFDVVFTANTLHIISWDLCKTFINTLGSELKIGSMVLIYGAFNYDGKYTSESNERFDQWLKGRDSQSGIRNFEEVTALFIENGFENTEDLEMPANNRFLAFHKKSVSA